MAGPGIDDAPVTPSQRLARGGFWAFLGLSWRGVLAIAASFFLARLLRPEDLGAYFLIISLTSTAAAGAQLGLHRAVVRFVADALGRGEEGRARQAIALCLLWGGVGGLVVGGAAFFGGGAWASRVLFQSQEMEAVSSVAAIGIVALALQSLIAEALRGFHDIRSTTIFGGLLAAALVVAVLSALWLLDVPAGLDVAVSVWVSASALSAASGGFVLWRKWRRLDAGGVSPAGELRAVIAPLWINGLLALGVGEIGIWIVGAAASTQEAALFGAAVRIAAFLTVPLSVVNGVIPPIVAELYGRGQRESLQGVLRGAATLALLPSLLIFAGLAISAEPLLGLLYGDFYREAAPLLVVLCLGQLVGVAAGPCGFALLMTGNESVLMWITAAYGAVTLIGALWLVGEHGAFGVACALGIALLVRNVAMLLALRRGAGVWSHAGLDAAKALRSIRSA